MKHQIQTKTNAEFFVSHLTKKERTLLFEVLNSSTYAAESAAATDNGGWISFLCGKWFWMNFVHHIKLVFQTD